MPIRVWRIPSPIPYAYRPHSYAYAMRTTSSYAYQQRRFHVQNIIFSTHTRMAYTIRVPLQGLRVSHAYGAYQRQNPHFQANPYAYCLVPYAYDQNTVFQICYGFSLLRDPSDPTSHSPIFHTCSFVLSITTQMHSTYQIVNLTTSNSYEFHQLSSNFVHQYIHKFITYIIQSEAISMVSHYPSHTIP
jgi:hypothetical protein